MIQFTLIKSLIPTSNAIVITEIRDISYIDPSAVETITRVNDAPSIEGLNLPRVVRSCIRVRDRLHGYRLLYVTETADELAEQWRFYMNRATPNYNLPDINE